MDKHGQPLIDPVPNGALDAHRASDEHFRLIADFTYDWELWVSPDGGLLYVSPACLRITGYGADDLIQNPDLLTRLVHPDDRLRFEEHRLQERAGPGTHSLDFRIVTRDGQERWIGHACQRVYGDDGAWLGWRSSNRDITAQKQAEQGRERQRRSVQILLHAAQQLMSQTTLDGLLQQVVQAARELTGARTAAAYHHWQEDGFAASAMSCAQEQETPPPAETLAAAWGAVRLDLLRDTSCRRLTRADLQSHAPSSPSLDKLLAARLVGSDGRVDGVLLAGDKVDGGLDHDDEALLAQLATIASLALQQVEARLELEAEAAALEQAYEELEVSDEELRLQNEELLLVRQGLEEAQHRLESTLNSITDGYYALDAEWRFVAANRVAEQHFERPRTALLGKNVWELTGTAPGSVVHRQFLAARTGQQPVHFEAQSAIRTDYWAEMHLYPREDRLEVYFRDISHRKRTEAELRAALAEAEEGRRTLDALLTYVPEGITIAASSEMELVRVSRFGQELLGGEHAGRTVDEVVAQWAVYEPDGVTPMDVENLPLVRAMEKREVVQDLEVVQVNSQGQRLWLSCNAGPILDSDGEVTGGIVAWRDVTDQKRAEWQRAAAVQALRESEARYRHLFDSMTEGFALHEILCDALGQPSDYRFLEINASFEQLTGLDRNDLLGRTVLEALPGTEPFWIETYGRVALTGEPIHFEHHSTVLDRHYAVSAYRPAENQFACVFMDVSERVQAEQARRENEAKLLALFEILPVGVSILDAERNVRYMNPALSRILDLPVTAADKGRHRQRSYRRPDGSSMRPDEFPSVRAVEEQRIVRDVEIGVVKEDGTLVWTNVSAAPLPFDDWSVILVTADVTERVLAQAQRETALAALRESQSRLEAVFASIPLVMLEYDTSLKPVRANAAALQAVGLDSLDFTRDQAVAWLQFRNLDGSQARPESLPVARALRGETVSGDLYRVRTADGVERVISTHAAPVYKEGQISGAVAMWDDITAQQQTEAQREAALQALGESEGRLRRVAHAGRIGLYEWATSQKHAYWSPEMYDLFGREPGAPTGFEEWLACIHPDDRDQAVRNLSELTEQARAGTRLDAQREEYRALHNDGTVLWLEAITSFSLDDNGGLIIRGAVRDITERKRGEQERERLIAILEATPDMVSTARVDGRVQYFNRAARGILGIPQDADLAGFDIPLGHPEWAARLVENEGIPTALRQGVWQGQTAVLGHDGREIPMSQIILAHRAPDGQVEFLSTVARDLSREHEILTQVQDARRRAEEQAAVLDTMLASIPDSVVFYGPDGRIARFNAAAQNIFGYRPDETIRSLAERVAQNRPTREDGTLFRVEELPASRALAGETVLGSIMALYLRPGPATWVSVSGAPVHGPGGDVLGAIVSFTDITELRRARDELEQRVQERTADLMGMNEALQSEIAMRRQAEAELRESELRFRQLAENVDEMFWLFEPQRNRVLYASPAFETLWGLPVAEAYRGPEVMLQTIHPDDQERLRAAWLARNGECDEEFRLVRPDGTVRWVRGRVFAVASQQSPEPRRAGIVSDVTAQKEALTALIHAERLTTAGRLAASLAHEINNPLQSAIGCLDLAREALEEGSDPLPFMQVIADALLRAARVVAQLRSLHRRTQPETRQAVDLGQILDEVLLLTQKKCHSQKVEVTCDVAADLPEMSVMPDAVQQVFLNLVLNAVDAMPQGGELRIEIRASSQPQGVYIRFADTGVGIAPEMRDRLFEPFQTTKTEGLGLGLFISHSIMQQHGGRIELESEAGNGTVFSLWLPA